MRMCYWKFWKKVGTERESTPEKPSAEVIDVRPKSPLGGDYPSPQKQFISPWSNRLPRFP